MSQVVKNKNISQSNEEVTQKKSENQPKKFIWHQYTEKDYYNDTEDYSEETDTLDVSQELNTSTTE